jgi:N-acetylglucosaminyl-diphospho-decaprenol L-rhamnosyltransferase
MPVSLATVIVVTHDSARWLARMLAALAAQTERRFRLVVVDNASRPEERPRVGDLPQGARLIQSEANLGFAAANNLAARGAETPYLVFLNPDAFPEPDWLARLIAAAERFPRAGAVGSTQLRADAPGVFDGAGDVLHASGLAYRALHGRRRAAPPPLGESFAACAAAMLVRREAFEAAGGFDERFFCFFEDVDLCFRLRLMGWRVVQSPDAIAAHVGGGAGGSAAFAEFHGARNRLWTFVKCMPAALFWPLLPAHLLASATAATLSLARGRGFSAWRGLIAGVGGLGPVWSARRELQRARAASWRDIAGALAWSPFVFFGRQPVIRPLAAD